MLHDPEGGVCCLAISPDSRWLATAGRDNLNEPSLRDPEGKLLANNSIRIWDLQSNDPARKPQILRGHEKAIGALAFSPDGRWLVSSGADTTARVWDVRNFATPPRVLKGTYNWAHFAFSANSRWLAIGSDFKTVQVWDLHAADSASHPQILRTNDSGGIKYLAFSPDNRWLVTGAMGGSTRIQLWLLDSEDLVQLAKTVAGRSLTADERTQFEVPAASDVVHQTSAFRPGLPHLLTRRWPNIDSSEQVPEQ